MTPLHSWSAKYFASQVLPSVLWILSLMLTPFYREGHHQGANAGIFVFLT